MKSERGYIIRIRIDWNPNLREISSKKEIIAPKGSVIKKENGIFIYKELIYCTIYSYKVGRYDSWKGVECEGNPENQISISIDNKEISACSVCSNQLSCIFQNDVSKNKFSFKEEYKDVEREKFIDWIFNNRSKYKIQKKPLKH
jgi:hypothetical protein